MPHRCHRGPTQSSGAPKFAAASKTCSRNSTKLPADLSHPLKNESAISIHVIRLSLQRQRQNRREASASLSIDIPSGLAIVVTARRFCAVNARTPLDHVQIEFQDALFAEHQFRDGHERELGPFAKDRTLRPEK